MMIGAQDLHDMPNKKEKKILDKISKDALKGYRWLKNKMLAEFSGCENGKIYN